MKKLQVTGMGTTVQGVRLYGDPKNPEPETFRVGLGDWGDVDVVRCDDGSYWVHVRINHPDDLHEFPGRGHGRVVDARVDHVDKNATETIELAEQLGDPKANHVSIRVSRQ